MSASRVMEIEPDYSRRSNLGRSRSPSIPLAEKAGMMLEGDVRLIAPLSVVIDSNDYIVFILQFIVRLTTRDVPVVVSHRSAVHPNPTPLQSFVRRPEPRFREALL